MSRAKELPRPTGNNACVIYDKAVEIIRELEQGRVTIKTYFEPEPVLDGISEGEGLDND